MLDIVQSVSSQVSRIFKLQEKELIFSEVRLIEGQAWPIENRIKTVFAEFKLGLSPWKRLGFQSNTPKYKMKTLTTFWRLLERLVSSSCEIWKVLYILTLQVSTGTRSTIKCWWNLIIARSTSSDLKHLDGISKSKAWVLVCYKSKREESMDSDLACDHVNKLLLQVAINLGLNLL